MRKIEREMLDVLTDGGENHTVWNKDNTMVTWIKSEEGYLFATVYLHGNLIAEYHPDNNTLMLRDAGWRTPTTKSRLNALLAGLGTGVTVSSNCKGHKSRGSHGCDWLIHNGQTATWEGSHFFATKHHSQL